MQHLHRAYNISTKHLARSEFSWEMFELLSSLSLSPAPWGLHPLPSRRKMRRSCLSCLMLSHTQCCPAVPPPQMWATTSPPDINFDSAADKSINENFFFPFQATATEDVAESLSPDDGKFSHFGAQLSSESCDIGKDLLSSRVRFYWLLLSLVTRGQDEFWRRHATGLHQWTQQLDQNRERPAGGLVSARWEISYWEQRRKYQPVKESH